MSLCRGIRQDGRRRDRGVQRRRHAHHRYALAVERREAHQDQYRPGATARCKSHRRSREHAREHRPVTGAGRRGVERLFVLAAHFCVVVALGPGCTLLGDVFLPCLDHHHLHDIDHARFVLYHTLTSCRFY